MNGSVCRQEMNRMGAHGYLLYFGRRIIVIQHGVLYTTNRS
ncbi:conserved hypothetical protein [delta proteobacterium NaphS2]|nr:conserved hypothetical protein [delta proteobacterium NaphS2]